MLGIEVHDVAGRQRDERGGVVAPPDDAPYLRTTRTLAAGQVVTVEPGLYFIASLLQQLRGSRVRDMLDWSLVDQLLPCGGMRVEDDVLVTDRGSEDLTHEAVERAVRLHEARGPDSGEAGYR
jgi:Xaa-Pro dipeptidase